MKKNQLLIDRIAAYCAAILCIISTKSFAGSTSSASLLHQPTMDALLWLPPLSTIGYAAHVWRTECRYLSSEEAILATFIPVLAPLAMTMQPPRTECKVLARKIAPTPPRRKKTRKPCLCPPPKPETCEQRANRLIPINNTIESTIVVQVGTKKECFVSDKLPLKAATGEFVRIFIRQVYSDNLFLPVYARPLHFTVLDSFGYDIPTRQINTDFAKTMSDGFTDRDIYFSATDIGVYRIRIDYIDRELPNFVLSPNIIIIGEKP